MSKILKQMAPMAATVEVARMIDGLTTGAVRAVAVVVVGDLDEAVVLTTATMDPGDTAMLVDQLASLGEALLAEGN